MDEGEVCVFTEAGVSTPHDERRRKRRRKKREEVSWDEKGFGE